MDRYIIIHTYKVLEGLIVPPETEDIIPMYSERRGRECMRYTLDKGPQRYQTLLHNSLSRYGPRLFNVMPRPIRDTSGPVEKFKNILDKYIQTIPDEPKLTGYTGAATSNGIIDQVIQISRN